MKRIIKLASGKVLVRTRDEKVLDYKRRKQNEIITSLMNESRRLNYLYC